MHEYRMDLCDESCSPVHQPPPYKARTLTLDITCNLFIIISTTFCHTAMLIGTIDLYHLIPLSLVLTLPKGHKTGWLHFLLHFSTDQDEICYGVEAIQAEHLDTIFG